MSTAVDTSVVLGRPSQSVPMGLTRTITSGGGSSIGITTSHSIIHSASSRVFGSSHDRHDHHMKTNPNILKLVTQANQMHDDDHGQVLDILQFSSPEYFCTEGEGYVEIQVDRLGSAKSNASVTYFTKDGSAKAGEKYVAQEGTLVFEAGATEHRLRIPLVEDDNFDSVLEFEVHLQHPLNARLDSYLYKTEITIVDDDAFPTNKYREEIKKGEAAKITPHSLLVEFFKMNFRIKLVRRACYKNIVSDQIGNLKYIWSIILTQYLIDEVLRPKDGSSPPSNAYMQVLIIVSLMMVPHPINWFLGQKEAERRVAGKSIAPLQANLMRKFLNYSEPSRKLVSKSDLTMSVTRDVPELVLEGFCMVFPILANMGLLIMLGTLAFRSSTGIHRVLNIIFFFAYPLCMCFFLGLRERGTVKRRQAIYTAQTELCAFVSKVTEYFRLICDYFQKQETVLAFVDKVKDCNKAQTAYLKYSCTNQMFAPFLTDIICGCFVLTTAQSVIDGGAVGEFIAGVSIFRGIGQCYQQIYTKLLCMQTAIAPLQNIVYYMNLPVDVNDRMAAHRVLLDELDKAQEASQRLLYHGEAPNCSLVQESTTIISGDIVEEARYAQDLVQIDCVDTTYVYHLRGGVSKHVLDNTSFEISQGQLVAVVGPRGSGKSTLLKLVAGVLVPAPGSGLFFVPPHLKIGHVTQHPEVIEDDSIWENLTFGPSDGEDESPERVVTIMRRLGMSKEIVTAVKKSTEKLASYDASSKSIRMAEKTSLEEQGYRAEPPKRNSKIHTHVPEEKDKQGHPVATGTSSSVTSRQLQTSKAENEMRMSHTDRALLHIARGLIMNPEILVMHKPLAHFDRMHSNRVLEILREYVDLRGIEKPLDERVFRRPRTVIFSCAAMEGTEMSDLVLQVDGCSVQQVQMDDLKELEGKAYQLFVQMDVDGDGSVSREEFCDTLRQNPEGGRVFGVNPDKLAGKSAADILKVLNETFDMLDHTMVGMLRFDEVWHFMRNRMHMRGGLKTLSNVKAGRVSTLMRGSIRNSSGNGSPMVKLLSGDGLDAPNGSSWEIPPVSNEGLLASQHLHRERTFGDA